MMDEFGFQNEVRRLSEMDAAARNILGLGATATTEEIMQAYRRLAREHHPDRNLGDEDAHRRFVAINCAREFLLKGTASETLLQNGNDDETGTHRGKYNLDNAWGIFAWWKEQFF